MTTKIANVGLLLVMTTFGAATACSSTTEEGVATAPSTSSAVAEKAFWSAFHGSDYDAIPAVIDKLQKAYDEAPKSYSNTLLLGHAHFWRVAESARDPSLGARAAAEGQAAGRFLGEALALEPSDARLVGWLGGLQVIGAAQVGDSAMRAQGLAMLDESVKAYPEFNLFSKGLSYAPLPPSDPDYEKAPASLFDLLDVCMSKPIDRAHPDYSARLADMEAIAKTGGHKSPCWNDAKAPHNIEGVFLWLGDMLVKKGDVAAAKDVYASAQSVSSYKTWPSRDVLESRLGEDLMARAAMYADPTKELGAPGAGCTTCHATE